MSPSLSAYRIAEHFHPWEALGCCLLFAMGLYWLLMQWGWRTRLRLPPGPALALPLFGHWLRVGDEITGRKMAKLAQKYGDIFLLKMGRRNLVVLHSPELAREMLHTQGVCFGSRASNIVFDIFTGSGQDLAFAEYGEHWRKARRIVTLPFFTTQAVQRWRSSWEAETGRLVENLAARPEAFTKEEGVMLRDRLHLMIYNVLYTVAFGRRFESEEDPVYVEMKRLNDERGRLVQNLDYNYADFHPVFYPLARGYLKTCHKVKERRESLFKQFISEYKTNYPQSKDIFGIDHMLAAIERGDMREDNVLFLIENLNAAVDQLIMRARARSLYCIALINNLYTCFAPGIPTMSSTIEWAIAELVNNPHIQAKLYAELCSVVGAQRELTEPDCAGSKLPYLQAVLKESMRLHTTVPLIVPHMNLKPAKLGGYDIPARSKLILNAWWLANNPAWWNEPEEFRPERFLGEEETVEMSGNHFKFLPFGSGRRQCPAIPMALPVLLLAIGKLVHKFELLAPPSSSTRGHKLDMSEQQGQFLLQMTIPPRVLLIKRRAPNS